MILKLFSIWNGFVVVFIISNLSLHNMSVNEVDLPLLFARLVDHAESKAKDKEQTNDDHLPDEDSCHQVVNGHRTDEAILFGHMEMVTMTGSCLVVANGVWPWKTLHIFFADSSETPGQVAIPNGANAADTQTIVAGCTRRTTHLIGTDWQTNSMGGVCDDTC